MQVAALGLEERPLPGLQSAYLRRRVCTVVRVNQHRERELAERLVAVAEHRGVGRIALNESAVELHDGDAGGRVLEDPTEPLLAGLDVRKEARPLDGQGRPICQLLQE